MTPLGINSVMSFTATIDPNRRVTLSISTMAFVRDSSFDCLDGANASVGAIGLPRQFSIDRLAAPLAFAACSVQSSARERLGGILAAMSDGLSRWHDPALTHPQFIPRPKNSTFD